jgi:Lsr2
MAQKKIVQFIDDIDGGKATQTVRFGLDGTQYEIDLSDENASKLRAALNDFVAKGRKLSRSGQPYRHVQVGPASRDVRAWARAKGYEVPERGRVPREFIEMYEKAQQRHQ